MAKNCLEQLKSVKQLFLNELKAECGEFVIDNDNRKAVGSVFHWCLRDKKGTLDPHKGLWIYGNIGTGKSTLMKAILRFVGNHWQDYSGENIRPRWTSAADLCGQYASDGFNVFDSIPMGLDALGAESVPTNHIGNKLNVVQHLIYRLYEVKSPVPKIVTSTLTLKGVLDTYGAATVDRIGELFNLVELTGATRRQASAIWDAIDAGK